MTAPESIARATSRCLLCAAPSALLGLFLPGDSQLWGAPAGRARTIAYGLCHDCYVRPDLTDAVEDRMFGMLARGAA